MKTIVSLVSDQTLPNLQLIKEFKNPDSEYWFFHSANTCKQAEWIANAAALDKANVKNFQIDPYDIQQIDQVLKSLDLGERDFILNMTGGTKLWIMLFLDFFKNLGADIYYLTGFRKGMVKVFPLKGQRLFTLSSDITLSEYLMAYGFTFHSSHLTHKFEHAQAIYEYVMAKPERENAEVFRIIHAERGNARSDYKKSPDELGPQVSDFLIAVKYPLNEGFLLKSDIRYLSGEWLEEWVYYKLKDELNLDDAHIATGIHIVKEGVANEMDVVFVYDHRLFTVECKTSVKEQRVSPDGTQKISTILGEVIYKSDSLRHKFGLFASSTLLVLSELRDENMQPKKEFQQHFDRAELSRISIISRRQLQQHNHNIHRLIPGLNARQL